MRQLVSKSTRAVIASIGFVLIAYVFRYAFNVFLTKHFSAELYGNFSIALRLLSLTATLSLLGTNTSLHHFFSRFYREGKTEQAVTYLDWNLRFIAPAFLTSVCVGVVLFLSMLCLHLFGIKALDNYHLAIHMFWVAPLASLCLLLLAVLVGIGRPKTSTFIRTVFRLFLFFIFFFVGVEWFELATSTLSIALVIFAVYVTILISELCSIGRIMFPICKNLLKKPKVNLEQQWKRLSLKLAYSNVIYLIVCATDLLIVEIIHPHEASVGYYAAVLLISGLIATVAGTAYVTLRPDVSRLLETPHTHDELRRRLLKNNSLCLVAMLVIAIVICWYGHQILAVFGQAYTSAYPVLVVSVLASLVISLCNPSTMLLAYSGNEKALMKINTIELFLLILIGCVLTFYFSIIGMAIATLIAAGTKSILFMITCYRNTGFKSWSVV